MKVLFLGLALWLPLLLVAQTTDFTCGDTFDQTSIPPQDPDLPETITYRVCSNVAGQVVQLTVLDVDDGFGSTLDRLAVVEGDGSAVLQSSFSGLEDIGATFVSQGSDGCLEVIFDYDPQPDLFDPDLLSDPAVFEFSVACVAPPACSRPTIDDATAIQNVTFPSVDFVFTSTGSEQAYDFRLYLVGGSGNSVLEEYTNQMLGTDVLVDAGMPDSRRFTFPRPMQSPDAEYFIEVRAVCSPGNESGYIPSPVFSAAVAPVNDQCSGAIPLPLDDACINETYFLNDATASGTGSCGNSANPDIWFTVSSTQAVRLEFFGQSGLSLEVYGGACGALTQVNCNILSGFILRERADGEDYLLRVVSNSSNDDLRVILCAVLLDPSNDDCSEATLLPDDGSGVFGFTRQVSPETGLCGQPTADFYTRYYELPNTDLGTYFLESITYGGSGVSSIFVELLEGTDCASATVVSCQEYSGTADRMIDAPPSPPDGVRQFLRVSTPGLDGWATFLIGARLRILAAELTTFRGEARDKLNRFTFSTASESEVSDFTLERTTDLRSDTWQPVGRPLPATNAGAVTTQYVLDDVSPLPTAYYRLRITDFDGSEEVSETIYLSRDGERALWVYPNPVTEGITLNRDDLLRTEVYDLSGRRLVTDVAQVRQLPTGTYLLRATTENGQTLTTRFVIRR